MKNRILKGIASLSLGIGLFGAGSVVANNYVNASAKTSSVQNTGKKTSKYTVKTWKQLWSSKYKNKLDQYGIEKYSMLYKNTKLYKNREYAGSTPAYSHKGYIPKTDIELATGVWHINLHCDIFAYMTNGHQIYLGANPSKSVEVVPGWHNLNDHFTNNTKHWKLYFVHGNGRIPNENERCYAETDNGTPTRVADKKAGYHNLRDYVGDVSLDSMAHINSKTDQGNGATLINKKAKIAINYPAISIQNASDWNTNYHE